MNDRQSFILHSVVNEYVQTAKPVGSKVLQKKYQLDCSSATIRNDMKVLEDEGYLHQPHTSAGRMPTDSGYRTYVNALFRRRKEDLKQVATMRKKARDMAQSNRSLHLMLTKVLSELSQNVAVQVDDHQQVSHHGLSYLLRSPEFQDVSKASDVAEILESDDVLDTS